MRRRMFSKFSNILQQAVEAIVPNLSLQEEFIHHWLAITNYFIENKGLKLSVDHTNLPAHLDHMLAILQQEESSCESGSTGPCMEYMLHNKLLETLYSLGKDDSPPCMKQIVLAFFTKLLTKITQPLLPHINVHRAVQRLVRICGEVKASPSENEEVQFLCTLCAKIKSDPYLVSFFLEVPKVTEHSRIPQSSAVHPPKRVLEFSLVNSLLALSDSEDGRIAVKACEGLMLCASLPDKAAANCLIQNTMFCKKIKDRLVQLYQRLPATINPDDLENVDAKWGLDLMSECEDSNTFPGKRSLVSFLSWLDYCDQLITVASPIVSSALTRFICSNFLVSVIEPALMQTSESGAIAATAYLRSCLRTVCSKSLVSGFVKFILGDNTKPEKQNHDPHKLRQRLIARCDHLSEELCLTSLKLLDTLLQKNDSFIVYNLVVCNLAHRTYLKSESCGEIIQSSDGEMVQNGVAGTSDTSQETTASPILESSKCDSDQATFPLEQSGQESQLSKPPPQSDEEASLTSSITLSEPPVQILEHQIMTESSNAIEPDSPISPTSKPSLVGHTEVHKLVNSFLCILPDEAKSSFQSAESGYDMYLRDAHRQFANIEEVCSSWRWPSMSDKKLESFYEGSFLRMLFDKVSRMLDQTYSINLQVTSLISRVAMFPHPTLQEYLLDPFLPMKDGVRVLHSILQKVAADIKVRMKLEENFTQKLQNTRKLLMEERTNLTSIDMEVMNQMGSVIVLEEFCKELSAIAFVKQYAAITRVS